MRETTALVLLPFALSFLVLWPALIGQGVLAPTDLVTYEPIVADRAPGVPAPAIRNPLMADVVDTFIPWKMLAREQLAQGRFPLWNPYNGLGTHFHANLQSQVFSPFNLLWLALPPLWGLGAVAALKWALAGLGMGLLLRRLGLGLAPALFGAVAFQLSGPMVAWLQWPISEGYAWVPWMMWAALGWLDRPSAGWLAALSAFVAFELLAGHVETSFHSLVFLGLFALAAWAALDVSGRGRWLSLGGLAAGALLGLVLSAAQLVPFFDVLPDSYQWWVRGRVHTAGFGLPASGALLWLTPNGLGPAGAYSGPYNWVEANPYTGTLTLLLVGAGLSAVRVPLRRARVTLGGMSAALSPRRPVFWAAMLVISVGMAYGAPGIGYLRELPGFSTSFNWRLVSVAGFCLAVLAAMSLQRFLDWKNPSISRAWTAPLAALLLLGAASLTLGGRVWPAGPLAPADYSQAWKWWAAGIFSLSGALLLARLLGLIKPRALGALSVGILALDLVRAAWGFNPTLPYETFYPPNPLLQFAAQRGPTERTAVVSPYAISNMLVPYRVPEYSVYDATIDNRYYEYTRLMSPETFRQAFRTGNAALTDHLVLVKPSPVLLSAVGFRWVLAASENDPNGWQPSSPGGHVFRRTLEGRGFNLWENTSALPFTYLARKLHVITPDENPDVAAAAREGMRSLSPGTGNIVQVEDPGRVFPAGAVGQNADAPLAEGESAQLESYAPGDIRVKVSAARPRFLVVNEGWSKGWRASVDGAATPLYRAQYLAQGLVVPAGEHTVRLTYDPPAFRWGVGTSAVGLAVWLGLVGHRLWRRRKVGT